MKKRTPKLVVLGCAILFVIAVRQAVVTQHAADMVAERQHAQMIAADEYVKNIQAEAQAVSAKILTCHDRATCTDACDAVATLNQHLRAVPAWVHDAGYPLTPLVQPPNDTCSRLGVNY